MLDPYVNNLFPSCCPHDRGLHSNCLVSCGSNLLRICLEIHFIVFSGVFFPRSTWIVVQLRSLKCLYALEGSFGLFFLLQAVIYEQTITQHCILEMGAEWFFQKNYSISTVTTTANMSAAIIQYYGRLDTDLNVDVPESLYNLIHCPQSCSSATSWPCCPSYFLFPWLWFLPWVNFLASWLAFISRLWL